MHLAATCNQPAALRALCEHAGGGGGDALRAIDVRGRTALHSAAQAGALDAAAELLRLGADPHAVDPARLSALAIAAASGHASICRLLLDLNPNMGDSDPKRGDSDPKRGDSDPNMGAPDPNMGAGLNDGDRRPLELAASSGSVETVALLLSRRAQIDAQPPSGKTALHAAARAGRVAAARALVDAGCALGLRDRTGRLASEIAPDAMLAEFRWLGELCKGAARPYAPPPGRTTGLEALGEPLELD